MIKNTLCGIYHALNGRSKSSSIEKILGIDIDTYRKWIEYEFTPEMKCSNIETDHAKPIFSVDVSNNDERKEAFNWKHTQTPLKQIHSQKGTKFGFLEYQLQIIKPHQFLRLNEEGFNQDFY